MQVLVGVVLDGEPAVGAFDVGGGGGGREVEEVVVFGFEGPGLGADEAGFARGWWGGWGCVCGCGCGVWWWGGGAGREVWVCGVEGAGEDVGAGKAADVERGAGFWSGFWSGELEEGFAGGICASSGDVRLDGSRGQRGGPHGRMSRV